MNLSGLRNLGKTLLQERVWVGLGLIYLSAWWLPISLFWPLLHPGTRKPEGIDGPVSWLWKNYWGNSASLISFEILIPVGVILLLLSYRKEAKAALLKPGKKFPYVLIAGCAGLIVSHLIHLPSLATASLITIAVGGVLHLWGTRVLRALQVPFLYFLLMIPPPESVAGIASKLLGPLTLQLVVLTLKLVGKRALAQPPQLILDGVVMEAGGIGTEASSGASALTATAALVLLWALLRRWPLGRTLMVVISGALIALLLNVLRVDGALLLRGRSQGMSELVLQFNTYVLALGASALTLFLDSRLSRAARGDGWLGKVLGPLLKGWQASERGADRVLGSSEKVAKGAAVGIGRVLQVITAPFVFVLNLVINGLGAVFKLNARVNKKLDQRLQDADRARRKKKEQKRQ
jgi:exosortase/archaeosortase family protein